MAFSELGVEHLVQAFKEGGDRGISTLECTAFWGDPVEGLAPSGDEQYRATRPPGGTHEKAAGSSSG